MGMAVTESSNTSRIPGMVPIPGWERFAWLRAGFSTRLGGHSQRYGTDEQNLGWAAQDDPNAVRLNREQFAGYFAQGTPMPLVTVQQIHGAVVRDLEQEPSPWMTADGKARMEGDGLISRTPGRLLAILTADCVPVLLADTRTHAIGAFHAGWRGTLAQIVQQGIACMQTEYGTRPADVVAAIGPCIGSCCFEVGAEVRERFQRTFPYAADLFSSVGEAQHLDLVEANQRQLLEGGLWPENISVVGECTACTRLPHGGRKYFSYRAEKGSTGRMLGGIAAIA